MGDDLTEMFSEAAAEDAGETEDVVDTPVDGTDDEVEVQDDEVEDEIPVADEDTDEEVPLDDDDYDEDDDEDFDWEAFADQKVTIKDNGEDKRIALSELKNGYLRHEDYSRKTAEIADLKRMAVWGQDVQQALKDDPIGTVNQIAQALGLQVVDPRQPQPPEQQAPNYDDYEPEVAEILKRMDAQEQRHQQELAQLQAKTRDFELERVKGEVRQEMQTLKARYPELDELETLNVAATYNVPLTFAAQALMGTKLSAKQASDAQVGLTAKEAADRRQAALNAANAKKKKQATGSRTKSFDSVDSEISAGDFDNIGELFEIEMSRTSG